MIELQNLSMRRGSRVVADALSLCVAPGETLAISGPSGSGKTSLLRLIAGLDRPDKGEIILAGERADSSLLPHTRGISFMFQSAALWPHLSVAGNIEFGLKDSPAEQRQARVTQLLNQLGLSGFAGRSPSTLSGGEARRVALARALAPQRPILLLDEPTSNLDGELREQVLQLIADECRANSITVVLATHERSDAERLANRCLSLRDGRLVAQDTP